MKMHSILLSILLAFLATSGVVAETPRDTQADAEKEVRRVIQERLEAYGRADAIAWGRFVADDCFCGTSTKAAVQREIEARLPNQKNWYGDITNFQVHLYGDVAVTRYQITEYIELSGQRMTVPQWRTETYARRSDGWKLIAGIENAISQDPIVAKIDPKLYDAYVGQYEYAPGVVDTVTREGNRFMVQATGQAKEEVFPENETTYFGKGQDWRMIFVKDKRGRVTSVRFRQHGQDLIAKKIR